MTEPVPFRYLPLTGRIPSSVFPAGARVLVQLFFSDDRRELLDARLAFALDDELGWGVPYQLEVRP